MGKIVQAKCSKNFLVFYNFLFVLIGGAFVGIGIWGRVKYSDYSTLTEDNTNKAAYFIIVVGAAIFLTSFMGCCGALRESVGMLKFYSFIMFLTFLCEIAIAVIGYYYRDKVQSIISTQITKQIDYCKADYTSNSCKNALNIMDLVQNDFNCCGNVSPTTDWTNANYCNGNTTSCAPQSCCALDKANVNCGATNANLYTVGCTAQFGDFVRTNLLVIAIVATVVLVFQIISIIASKNVYREIEDGKYV